MIAAADIVAALGLEPHPEGGFFRETYRSRETLMTVRGPRVASTAIFFLLTVDAPSRFHRLRSDELWLHHGGARVELVALLADGSAETVVLGGAGLIAGAEGLTPQAIVPRDAWQAARVLPSDGGLDWSVVSCVVTPGFDYADFELGDAVDLLGAYPDQADLIAALT